MANGYTLAGTVTGAHVAPASAVRTSVGTRSLRAILKPNAHAASDDGAATVARAAVVAAGLRLPGEASVRGVADQLRSRRPPSRGRRRRSRLC